MNRGLNIIVRYNFRWKLVTHGGIDGKTRKIVYLGTSNNNRKETVQQLFLGAVEGHGLPSRIRADHGTENVDVEEFMLHHPLRGPGRGSFLKGRSVHNQRIERLWGDLFVACICVYHDIFSYLENAKLLNILSDMHLFALHFVFLPRINRHLQIYATSYNDHPLSTEKGKSPNQLWTMGNLYKARAEYNEDASADMLYGIDWDGTIPRPKRNDVQVEPIRYVLSDMQLEFLRNMIDPLAVSDCHGLDIYRHTLDCLARLH